MNSDMLHYALRLIFRIFAPNFVRRIFQRWQKNPRTALSEAKREFISLNTPNWTSKKTVTSEGFVLTEGFLAAYGPNYLLRTAIIAKAIEEELHLSPLILFDKYEVNESERKALYRSFNIVSFTNIYNHQPCILDRIKNALLALNTYRNIEKPDDLLDLEYNGIIYGDLLYDTILKETSEIYTISNIGIREYFYINEAIYLIATYNNLLKTINIMAYISTHSQYLKYGLILRVCLSNSIPSIESTDILLWNYQCERSEGKLVFPKYHDYLHERISLCLRQRNEDVLIDVDCVLRDRFVGQYDQSDVRMAYKDKRIYTISELREILEIQNSYPFVIIFAHILSDSPQSASNGMLFRDYYVWLLETLKEASLIDGVNWIVKPHPASQLYCETGMVEQFVAQHKTPCMFMCPEDLNPASVIDIASAIITAQGTVGIEYSCMGIPVVLAGRPFYSRFGFTIEPGSIMEYKKVLREIHTYNRLSEEQKLIAKRVFSIFMKMQQTDTTLIDSTLLLTVWSGEDPHTSSDRAFELINQRLANFNIMDYSLYKATRNLVRNFVSA